MELKNTARRKQISDFFDKKDFASLIGLGLRIIGEEKKFDCATYALKQVGVPGTPNAFSVLDSLPNSESAPRGDGFVFYGFRYRGKFNIRHYGWYSGGKVRSKWGFWNVFEHNIEDVPALYGDVVLFREDSDDVRYLFQNALQ